MKLPKIFMPIMIVIYSLHCFSVLAQVENTMVLDTSAISPTASLDAVTWIAGSWEGEAFNAKAEEVWATPSGNSMMGMFKLYDSADVIFYELMVIREVDSTLLLQIKHFNNDLIAWEEKGETVDFKLVKVEPTKVYFDGLTFELMSEDELNVYVQIGHKDGSSSEEKFAYKRISE